MRNIISIMVTFVTLAIICPTVGWMISEKTDTHHNRVSPGEEVDSLWEGLEEGLTEGLLESLWEGLEEGLKEGVQEALSEELRIEGPEFRLSEPSRFKGRVAIRSALLGLTKEDYALLTSDEELMEGSAEWRRVVKIGESIAAMALEAMAEELEKEFAAYLLEAVAASL